MKKCYTEIMKEIKRLEEEKNSWVIHERNNCRVSYITDEEPIMPNYDYAETSEALLEYDNEIRKLKGLLAYANATTIVEGFDMTIHEALVYLVQLNERVKRYNYLIGFQELTRKTVGIDGKIEYTKIIYDQKDASRKYEDAKTEVIKLQMAIDRTNLTSYIDC